MVSKRIYSLKKKSDFRELVTKGNKAKSSGWLTLDYLVHQDKAVPLQFGLSISRKIGNAVTRNKIKRWSREFFRKVVRESKAIDKSMTLNLRLREKGEFYKNLRHSEFDIALEKAWRQIEKHA